MNRRQKKKQFKKRFGINPPRGISIKQQPTQCNTEKKLLQLSRELRKQY